MATSEVRVYKSGDRAKAIKSLANDVTSVPLDEVGRVRVGRLLLRHVKENNVLPFGQVLTFGDNNNGSVFTLHLQLFKGTIIVRSVISTENGTFTTTNRVIAGMLVISNAKEVSVSAKNSTADMWVSVVGMLPSSSVKVVVREVNGLAFS